MKVRICFILYHRYQASKSADTTFERLHSYTEAKQKNFVSAVVNVSSVSYFLKMWKTQVNAFCLMLTRCVYVFIS